MAKGVVKIACKGADVWRLASLEGLQGNLKSLSKDNYAKLKKELLELGFSEPISVWSAGDKAYILNGHQRVRTLLAMRDEGYDVPDKIPISWVEADDIGQARLKVFSLASQYGTVDSQGLYEFMSEAKVDMAELQTSFAFPDIDMEEFAAAYFHQFPAHAYGKDVTDAKPKYIACPECGHEFTP